MQSGDREEFTKTLRVLCAARSIPWTVERDEAFWKGLARMSLIQFNRAVDDMCAAEDPPKFLTPGQVWQAYKSSRAAATPSLTLQMAVAFKDFDHWALFGNKLLRHHVNLRIYGNARHYGEFASWEAMKASNDPHADASPAFVANLHTLVAAKNRWVELMRDAEGDGGAPPPDEQKHSWTECMRQAEAQIAASANHADQVQAA